MLPAFSTKTKRTATFIYLHVCTNMQMIDFDERSDFFKALGDPVRLKIVDFLLNKTDCCCVCDISKHVSRDVSVASRHVDILKKRGIISTTKKDKCLICCIKDKQKIRRLMEG